MKLILALTLSALTGLTAFAQCPDGRCQTYVPQFVASAPAVTDDANCQAPVPAEFRCRNMTGVQCAWASLRTMALRARMTRLADLCARKSGPLWSPSEIEAACRECGVAIERVGPGDHERLFGFLERHVSNGKRPCWIGVQHGRHAVLCVHFERGKRVKLLGNSSTPWVFEFSWDQFLAYGPDGLAFALPADGTTTTPAKADDAALTYFQAYCKAAKERFILAIGEKPRESWEFYGTPVFRCTDPPAGVKPGHYQCVPDHADGPQRWWTSGMDSFTPMPTPAPKTADAPAKEGAAHPAAPPPVMTVPMLEEACPNGVCPAPTRPRLFPRVFGRR